MKHFWIHRDHIPEGVTGYGQFSFGHFVWLLLTVLLTALTAWLYRHGGPADKLLILRSIAAALMILEALKMFLMWRTGVSVSENLPLEICSFAAYSIVLDSIHPERPFFSMMLLVLFLPAAIMAVLFPTTSPLPAVNFYTIHQFLYHGLIIAYVLARYLAGEIPVLYSEVWGCIGKILVLVAVMYVVDTLFRRNFMFLKDAYGNPLLGIIWKVTGGGFAYTIGLISFCIFMVHVFFGIFKVIALLLHL